MFDQYNMFCQLLVLVYISGAIIVSIFNMDIKTSLMDTSQINTSLTDRIFAYGCLVIWCCGNAAWAASVSLHRRRQHTNLQEGGERGALTSPENEVTEEVQKQIDTIRPNMHFRAHGQINAADPTPAVRAVSIGMQVWILHDIDPISATFECKFTVCLEFLDESAIGLEAGKLLTPQQMQLLDIPELDVHNKVDLTRDSGPHAYVISSQAGQVLVYYEFHGRLQLHLTLQRFPFDSQRLPVDLMMPSEKDRNRAFVFRGSHISSAAQELDEWSVEGQNTSTDFIEGVAHATLEIRIKRRSGFYVASVFAVLFGISSLVFTVFVIEVDAKGPGFIDQGKILAPLMMTLLAFKLLTAAGKIPKCAKATIFDKYMLTCEANFFITLTICIASRALAGVTQLSALASTVQNYGALVLFISWVVYNMTVYCQVNFGDDEKPNACNGLGTSTGKESMACSMNSQISTTALYYCLLIKDFSGAPCPAGRQVQCC